MIDTRKRASPATKLPPDPENRNHERAQWAETAVSAFRRETGADFEDSLPDLLCDLMHLADRRGWDFAEAMERAQAHYEVETTPDPSDLLGAAKLVIDRWSSGNLAEAVRHLEAAVNYQSRRKS
jgi:hypothetical protein